MSPRCHWKVLHASSHQIEAVASSAVNVSAAKTNACHRQRDSCQWPKVPFFCILDAWTADRSRLRDPASVRCGDDRSSAAWARRDGNNRAPASRSWQAPKRHVQQLREPYTNSLTPSSLSICGFRHPTQGYVQLQWYVPIAVSFGVYPSIRHASTNLVGSTSILGRRLLGLYTPETLQDSPCSASRPSIRRPRSSTCGHVSFLPSTSHVFRLRHNRTGNSVADLRLFRPPSSGAA